MRATTFNWLVAERVGFEPTNTGEDVTGIPVQRLRPLGHLSDQWLTANSSKQFRSAARGMRAAPNHKASRPGGASGRAARRASGLRGLRHLERRWLIETGLPAGARRWRGLGEGRQMQRVG